VPEPEDEQFGPDGGPWEGSAGRVGAPAPPPWSSPRPDRPAVADAGPRAGAASDLDGHAAADAGARSHHRDERFPPHRDVYGVRGFGHSQDGYASQPPRRRLGPYLYGRSSRRYNRAYYGRTRPNRPASPHAVSIGLLVAGAVTAGAIYPVFALVALGAGLRTRRRTTSLLVPPTRTWLIYSVVFAVLGVTSITLIAVFGNNTPTASGPPLVTKTVALGQPATVLADVTDSSNRYVPVTVTVSDVTHQGLPAGSPDDTMASFRICAGPVAIAPYLVTSELFLEPSSGDPIAVDELSGNVSDSSTLLPGRCLSGDATFKVPPGSTLTAAQYGILQIITWPLTSAAGG
jgi:membrane protein implicated in regulation of membrane protease activity